MQLEGKPLPCCSSLGLFIQGRLRKFILNQYYQWSELSHMVSTQMDGTRPTMAAVEAKWLLDRIR